MKGIVFNVLEEVVTERYGADAWDALLPAADSSGEYTSLGSYPDGELMRLVTAASAALDTPSEDLVRWFGQEALTRFATRFPVLFRGHTTTRTFLLTLNDIIHTEVRKLYPGAETPNFEFDTSSPDVLIMRYRSSRRLCAFAVGLTEGAATYYGERATIEQPECMLRGDESCVLVCSFAKEGVR